MRLLAGPNATGLSVKGFAGTYVVLLAFNCASDYCAGLLGFGIRRTDIFNGEVIWLRGLKKFDIPDSDDGESVTTLHHPIQKFHWGDYTVKQGRTYIYEVFAMRGTKDNLVPTDSVTIRLTCEIADQIGQHGHSVNFNRSAAASQAFDRRFPDLPLGDVVDPNARKWLSRGLQEALTGFIDQAQAGQVLHCFLYEFSKPEYAQALKAARARGVIVQILHDAIIGADGKGPILESGPLLQEYGLDDVARGRTGDGLAISHNKFVVLSDGAGNGLALLTGSTNFSDAAVYAQTNVAHIITGEEPATTYLRWHQAIWDRANMSASDSRQLTADLTPLPVLPAAGTNPVFSPRTSVEAIELCARLVTAATDIVCFTAPFAVHDDLERALVATPAQVFGLLNKHGVVGKAMYDAPNTLLTAPAALNDRSVLEAWQAHMLDKLRQESLHHSGVFIHSKVILIDPLSNHPVTVTGSANFSNNSSRNNDENQLFIFDETEVADVYIGEFMRMFDHYYFRDHIKAAKAQAITNPKAAFLDETDAWTQRYYDQGEREKERLAFFS